MTFHYNHYLVGGWTNPFEKYARQNGFIFPNFRGEHINIFELPPPSYTVWFRRILIFVFSIIPISLVRMSSPVSNNQPRFWTPLKLHCQQLPDAKNVWWFGNGPLPFHYEGFGVSSHLLLRVYWFFKPYMNKDVALITDIPTPYMKMYIFPS